MSEDNTYHMLNVLKSSLSVLERARSDAEHADRFASILQTGKARIASGYGEAMTHGRGDAELVKHFTIHRPQVIKEYYEIPYIQFLRGEYVMDLWQQVSTPDHITKDKAYDYLVLQGLRYLAFPSVVFYFPGVMDTEEGRKNWIVCKSLDLISERYIGGKLPSFINGRPLEEFVYMQFFGYSPKAGVLDFDGIFIDRFDPSRMLGPADYSGFKSQAENVKVMCNFALVLFAYLAQCPERTVEVRPSRPRAPRDSKTAKLKPWLRDDVPHMILIDPNRAPAYGCQPRQVESGEAKRKAPVPHARRGHWRRLSEDRRVHVRASWIGPNEWTFRNAVYKIVEDRKQ